MEEDKKEIKTLIDEVKRYLKITWDDEDTDVSEYIEQAKQYIDETISPNIDFSKDKIAKGLLKDYCRYLRNNSMEYFESNFVQIIQKLQIKYASKEVKK